MAIETIIAQILIFFADKYFTDEIPRSEPQSALIEEMPEAIRPEYIIIIPIIKSPKPDASFISNVNRK